ELPKAAIFLFLKDQKIAAFGSSYMYPQLSHQFLQAL
ncbi:hypothetical protein PMI23_04949, partial [Pseudomonas sp. GM24]